MKFIKKWWQLILTAGIVFFVVNGYLTQHTKDFTLVLLPNYELIRVFLLILVSFIYSTVISLCILQLIERIFVKPINASSTFAAIGVNFLIMVVIGNAPANEGALLFLFVGFIMHGLWFKTLLDLEYEICKRR